MLSRRLLSCLLILLFLPLPCFSADDKSDYWEKLKNKLANISPQKRGPATTAVGGVRGSKTSADFLYWKGEEERIEVSEEEFAIFQGAYQLAVAGSKEEAVARFEAFLKDFPQSPIAIDARLALEALQ